MAASRDSAALAWTPETIEHKIAVLRDHCGAVGRDPAEITLTVGANVVIRRDRASAEAVYAHQLAVAIGEAVTLFRNPPRSDARVRLREVDDRQHDFGEAAFFERGYEAGLHAAAPRRFFDQERSRSRWVSAFRGHQVKNLFPDSGRGSRLLARLPHRCAPSWRRDARTTASLPSVVVMVVVPMRAVGSHVAGEFSV